MIPILLVLCLGGCAARSASAERSGGAGTAGDESADVAAEDRAAARRAVREAYYRQVEEEARRRGRRVIWINPPHDGPLSNGVVARERIGRGPLVAP
jgi:hypothetical protein